MSEHIAEILCVVIVLLALRDYIKTTKIMEHAQSIITNRDEIIERQHEIIERLKDKAAK